MTNPCPFPLGLEQGPVLIRSLRSISPAQADIVAQEVAKAAASWRVERHDDYDGYLSIVISSDREDAPTFAITGVTGKIELCEVQDDTMQVRGSFGSVAAAAASVASLVRSVSL